MSAFGRMPHLIPGNRDSTTSTSAADPLLSVSTPVCMTAFEWYASRCLQIVQWTLHAHCALLNYMHIDHRSAHILVSEQFLDSSNIRVALQ